MSVYTGLPLTKTRSLFSRLWGAGGAPMATVYATLPSLVLGRHQPCTLRDVCLDLEGIALNQGVRGEGGEGREEQRRKGVKGEEGKGEGRGREGTWRERRGREVVGGEGKLRGSPWVDSTSECSLRLNPQTLSTTLSPQCTGPQGP